MKKAELTQAALAERAGVSQKTISNYLNPGQRTEGAKGKEPSAKLTELDKIASALNVGVWQLVRQMTEGERKSYESIEAAFQSLRNSAAEREESHRVVANAKTDIETSLSTKRRKPAKT